eukprot:2392094-Amphidinium_carterae.1
MTSVLVWRNDWLWKSLSHLRHFPQPPSKTRPMDHEPCCRCLSQRQFPGENMKFKSVVNESSRFVSNFLAA